MKRLIAAAVLATGLHGLLLASSLPWQAPARTALNPDPLQVTLTAPPAPAKPTAPPRLPMPAEPIKTLPSEIKEAPVPTPKPVKTPPPTPQPIAKPQPAPKPIPPPRKPGPTPQKSNPMTKDASQSVRQPPPTMPSPSLRSTPPAPLRHATAPRKVTKPTSTRASQKPAPAVVIAVPRYRDSPPPAYPRRARRKGIQGMVRLAVWVDPTGAVEKLALARSSGYDILDRSALDAVKNWRFDPATRNGQAIASQVEIPVEFKLER